MLHLSSYYLIVYLGVRLVYYIEHVVITRYAGDQRVILGEPCALCVHYYEEDAHDRFSINQNCRSSHMKLSREV